MRTYRIGDLRGGTVLQHECSYGWKRASWRHYFQLRGVGQREPAEEQGHELRRT